jgi:hypothetical protein
MLSNHLSGFHSLASGPQTNSDRLHPIILTNIVVPSGTDTCVSWLPRMYGTIQSLVALSLMVRFDKLKLDFGDLHSADEGNRWIPDTKR